MAEGYVRTKVRARNPERGVYRTLDQRFEIRAAEKAGMWDVYRLLDGGRQRFAAEVKGYDRALDRVLEEPGVELEALNTPPVKAKPEPEAPQATTPAVEAKPKRQRRKEPATA